MEGITGTNPVNNESAMDMQNSALDAQNSAHNAIQERSDDARAEANAVYHEDALFRQLMRDARRA